MSGENQVDWQVLMAATLVPPAERMSHEDDQTEDSEWRTMLTFEQPERRELRSGVTA
jgi:hypothetical protein